MPESDKENPRRGEGQGASICRRDQDILTTAIAAKNPPAAQAS